MFTTESGKPLDPSNTRRALARIGRKIGLPGLHRTRCATPPRPCYRTPASASRTSPTPSATSRSPSQPASTATTSARPGRGTSRSRS